MLVWFFAWLIIGLLRTSAFIHFSSPRTNFPTPSTRVFSVPTPHGKDNSNSNDLDRWNESQSPIALSLPDSGDETKDTNETNDANKMMLPTGLEPWQEQDLERVFDDVLFRMLFLMQRQAFLNVPNTAVRDMFQTCIESVEIANSTKPSAGRGLFATRDIPKGTIISFYPIHSIGCKFDSGSCLSVQIAESSEAMIDVEKSAYALYSLVERPLLGIDLMKEYPNHHPKLFVDMNPKARLYDGWFCGLINDSTIVTFLGDTDYYRISRGDQRNVEIIPFSRVAPFQVGVTTRPVKKGEELFVSYGYNYWANQLRIKMEDQGKTIVEPSMESMDEIRRQEEQAAMEMLEIINMVEERYAQAAEGVAKLLEGLGDVPIAASKVENRVASSSRQRLSNFMHLFRPPIQKLKAIIHFLRFQVRKRIRIVGRIFRRSRFS